MTQPFSRLLLRVVLAGLIVAVWADAASFQPPRHSDATHEWLLLKAASAGMSPIEDVKDLAETFDVPYEGPLTQTTTKVLAYRTPGGLLLTSPLLLVDWYQAHAVASVVGVAAFLWLILALIPRFSAAPMEKISLPLALCVFSISFREATRWGSLLVVAAVCTTILLRNPTGVRSGVSLAVATVLKLFPGMVVVPLLIHRRGRWAAFTAGAIGLVLSIAGSVAFGISPSETLRLFAEGSSPWLLYEYNISLGTSFAMAIHSTLPLVLVPLLGIAAVITFSLKRPLVQSIAFGLCVAVLVNPVAWISYGVLLLPIVVWLWARYGAYPIGRYVAFGWLLVEALTIRIAESTSEGLARSSIVIARVILALAVAAAPTHLWYPDVESGTVLRSR